MTRLVSRLTATEAMRCAIPRISGLLLPGVIESLPVEILSMLGEMMSTRRWQVSLVKSGMMHCLSIAPALANPRKLFSA